MSLDGLTSNCNLANYPSSRNRPAAMSYYNGSVIACGGEKLIDSNRCWKFNGSAWSTLPNSNQTHCGDDSFSMVVEQGLWITGRRQVGDGSCSIEWSSEIFTGEHWVPGPPHPTGSYSSFTCIANLNSTHSLFTGGFNSTSLYSSETWLYDWRNAVWTKTAPMKSERALHGCTSLRGQGVLVVGGTNGRHLRSAELYDPVNNIWTVQPDLPTNISRAHRPHLLNLDGRVIGLFQNDNQIYQRSDDGSEWSVLPGVQLPNADLFKYKGDLVPGDFVSSCIP